MRYCTILACTVTLLISEESQRICKEDIGQRCRFAIEEPQLRASQKRRGQASRDREKYRRSSTFWHPLVELIQVFGIRGIYFEAMNFQDLEETQSSDIVANKEKHLEADLVEMINLILLTKGLN